MATLGPEEEEEEMEEEEVEEGAAEVCSWSLERWQKLSFPHYEWKVDLFFYLWLQLMLPVMILIVVYNVDFCSNKQWDYFFESEFLMISLSSLAVTLKKLRAKLWHM